MDKNNEKEIIHTLANYAASVWARQSRDLGAVTYAAYGRILSDLPAPVVDMALAELARTMTFWPAAAEIRATADKIMAAVTGHYQADETEAWAEVQARVRDTGLYHAMPKFSSPAIALAAKRFGWLELCTLQSDQVGVARAQFCRFYQEIVKREAEKTQMDRMLASATPAQKNQLAAIAQLTTKAVGAHLA